MGDRSIKEQTITKQLRLIYKVVLSHSKRVEKVCGLSSAKLWMLHEIAHNPGIRVSQLARLLSIHPSTCSNMLDKIEASGLICRDRSKTDQRSVHLSATERGKQLLKTAPSPHQGQLISALEKLSEEQISTLESGLEVFVKALNLNDDSAAMRPIPEE
jgi:DNA-binding MarR family transcriptional regulator